MASGTKIRPLARQLDTSAAVLWAIDSRGGLVYLSAGASEWLGIDAESLIQRRCVAGTPASDDPLDRLAASLSPPPGLMDRGWMSLRVTPPPISGREVAALDVGFVRFGDDAAPLTMAVGGSFDDAPPSAELSEAVAFRRQLDAWRKRQATMATIVTAGTSPGARRTRARLHVAAATRVHIGFYGPRGCGAETIARRIHQLSAGDEPLAVVDGPLMDPELLDATVTPLINRLADSDESNATALVRGLDETPPDVQQRLAELLATYAGRFRLLAVCRRQPRELVEPFESAADPLSETQESEGVHPRLVDSLSGLAVTIEPLATRAGDIPLLAAALLDARHAAGEGTAERFNRQALDALVTYPWPGNFEELDAVVRHAIRSTPHRSIGVDDLPLAVRSFRPANKSARPARPTLPLEVALRRYEMRLIRDAVEAAGGNRAEASRQLGISRATLLRRLENDGDS